MPQSLVLQRLDDLRRRIRRLFVLDGLGRTVAAAVLLTGAAVGADYLLRFPAAVRIGLLFAVAAAWLWVLVRRFVGPVATPLRPADLALRLERAFPQFGDRLASAVSFLQTRQDSPESQAMADSVVADADRAVSQMDLSTALRPRRAYFSLAAGVLAAIAAAGVYLSDEELVGVGLARLFNPMSDARWPTWVAIDPATLPAGPDRHRSEIVGRVFEWEIAVARGDSRGLKPVAWINHNVEDPAAGRWTPVDLVRVRPDEPRFKLAVKVGRSFLYWFEAGDDARDPDAPFRLDAVPRVTAPYPAAVELQISPPEYTGLPAASADLREGPASAVAGSLLRLMVRPDREPANRPDGPPDAEVFLRPVGRPAVADGAANPAARAERRVPLTWAGATAESRVLSAEIPLDGDYEIRVRLGGPGGRESLHAAAAPGGGFEFSEGKDAAGPAEVFSVQAVADARPRARFELPERREIEVLAGASVPMRLLAEDDFGFRDPHGIGQVRLAGRVVLPPEGDNRDRTRPFEHPLLDAAGAVPGGGQAEQVRPAVGRTELRVRWNWDLAPLKLAPGDVVEYVAAVRDAAWISAPDGRRVPLHPEPELSDFTVDREGRRVPSHRRLRVLSAEDFAVLLRRDFAEVQKAVARAAGDQKTLQRQLEPTAQKLMDRKAGPLNAGDKAQLAELEASQAALAGRLEAAADQLDKIGRRMAWNNFADPKAKALAEEVAKALQQVARRDVGRVNDNLRAGREQPDKPQQAKALDEAGAAQAAVARNLAALADRMREWSGLSQLQGRAMELSENHRAVTKDTARRAGDPEAQGKDPGDLSPAEREKNNRLAERQGELAKEVDKLAEDLERFARENEKQDKDLAERVRKAAESLKNDNVKERMDRAAKSIAGNRAGNAGHEQDEAQQGLDRLQDVLEGKKDGRDLDALIKKFAGALESVRELIRRQERHLADTKARQAGGADGKNDAKDGLKPTARIAGEQEQTRRNAEVVAEELRELREAADAELEVGRAAVRMQRSSKQIAAEEWPGSLEDQNKALEHLRKAAQVLADLAAKKRKERQDRQAAAVAAELVKIRDAQDGLRTKTAELAKKLAAGRPSRPDLARAAELARGQEDLKHQTGVVRGRLKKTVVYQWVLEQVGGLMEQAGESLKQRKADEAGGPQADAIARLEQLIESLKQDDRERAVDVASGGGAGGGGGGPVRPVPPVAELKMLRAMQLDLNKKVRALDVKYSDADKLEPADVERIRTLGGLQEMIHKMAREMAEELQKARAGAGG
jgi:hypothetical protein